MPGWTIVPAVGKWKGNAFTHLVAYFEPGRVFYPEVPPPQGVVVRADVDRLTIRCSEWGTAYFWRNDPWAFAEYLRQLPSRASKFLVAAVHVDEKPGRPVTGVIYFSELALWLGAPQTPIETYDDYPRKDKPHRVLVPDNLSKDYTIPGRLLQWECDVDDVRELFPKGVPNP